MPPNPASLLLSAPTPGQPARTATHHLTALAAAPATHLAVSDPGALIQSVDCTRVQCWD